MTTKCGTRWSEGPRVLSFGLVQRELRVAFLLGTQRHAQLRVTGNGEAMQNH